MAEMYGELMEFNDHLHKEVATKDGLIIKLSHTLQLANIKVLIFIFIILYTLWNFRFQYPLISYHQKL